MVSTDANAMKMAFDSITRNWLYACSGCKAREKTVVALFTLAYLHNNTQHGPS